ncbi:M48 family metallopeptidase [Candidatus Dojkabacteria bacterium]|uniref:M48 family metallopeptidase n=1 Tax=Candidatus Dojkabacteria bacterium TaxID=2099670 RepID=A0A955LAT1_9BACT|nr:M48 family metallopeptidase [Candidatus Dojkabacteria bacterium]
MKLSHNLTLPILGEQKRISFEQIKATKPIVFEESNSLKVFISELHDHTHEMALEKWLRERFRKHAEERVDFFSDIYKFEFNRIAIKDTRSRWGSCSSKLNLNFSWRLIFTPLKSIDYVLVHELAHTKQMNHSKNFWAIVEEIMPDYKVHKKILHELEKEIFN